MDIKKAANLVVKKYPGRIPIGYWIRDSVIIINTRPMKSIKNIAAPGQFAVTEQGDIYGVTPMAYDLEADDMKKL